MPFDSTVRPSSAWSSSVELEQALARSRRHHFIQNRQALFSSRHVVPPGSDGPRTPSAFRAIAEVCRFRTVRLKTGRVPSEITGQGVPSPGPSSFRRRRSRVSGCCSSCSRWSGAVIAACMAAFSADTRRLERVARRAAVARPRRLLDPRLPARPLLARAGAGRGRRGLPDPARHAGRPAAAGARASVFRSLYGGPLLRLRPLRAVDGRAASARHAGRGDEQLRRRPRPRAWAPPSRRSSASRCRSRCAPRRSIQRRLTSIVQNSTDVVTIVGDGPARPLAGRLDPRRARPRTPTRSSAADCTSWSTRTTAPRSTATSPRPQGRPDHARNLTLRLAHGDGGLPPLRRRRRQPPARPQRRRLRAQHARRDRPPRARVRAALARRPARARRDARPADRPRQPPPPVRPPRGRPPTAARAAKTKLALLLIDLDHFKELNDTLGHQAGDRLLREIGPRLEAGVPGRRARRPRRRRRVRRPAAARHHRRGGRGDRRPRSPARSRSPSASRA